MKAVVDCTNKVRGDTKHISGHNLVAPPIFYVYIVAGTIAQKLTGVTTMQLKSIAAERQRVMLYLTPRAIALLDAAIAARCALDPPAPPATAAQARAQRKALIRSRQEWRYASFGHTWDQDHPEGKALCDALIKSMPDNLSGPAYQQAIDRTRAAWLAGEDLPPLPDGRVSTAPSRVPPATYIAGDIVAALLEAAIPYSPPHKDNLSAP